MLHGVNSVLVFLCVFGINLAVVEQMYYITEENKKLGNNSSVFKTTSDIPLLQCASHCLFNKACCSADYDQTTALCNLCSDCYSSSDSHSNSTLIKTRNSVGFVPHDCGEIPSDYPSGIYKIYLTSAQVEISVYCDMDTSGGGWTVFQRREDGSVDFLRGWSEYKIGFGQVDHEHWLGNDNIHQITSQGIYMLRVDLEDFNGNVAYAEYSMFRVADELSKYILLVGAYNGNAGDSMLYHNGMMFSTSDMDNDMKSGTNCASGDKKGAWWYNACANVNLNGLYYPRNGAHDGNYWHGFKSYSPLMKSTMMMKRILNG